MVELSMNVETELSKLCHFEENGLVDYFEVLPKQSIKQFWIEVHEYLKNIVLLLTQNCFSDDDHQQWLETIHTIVQCATCFVKRNCLRSSAFLHIIDILGSLLDILSNGDIGEDKLKDTISLFCEQWYLSKEPSGSHILPHVITHLLVESLKPFSKEIFVKRIFNIRFGFEELDLAAATADFNTDLLLRCFIHPTYLKSTDGVKFLSYLLTVSNCFLLEPFIEVLKSQSVSGGRSISKIYGEVLYRAWKDLSFSSLGSSSQEIENTIQDLVHEAVHSADSRYFRGLRILIKSFHDTKRTNELDEMLVKVFEPILWRSLRCANATVRSQAAILFLDVFPLQKIRGRPEECDQLLQKQFDQLISLLKDGDHRVRATAVSGIFHILREYWDIIPAATTQNILKFVFETLAFDVSSANVRFCVISGIRELLAQPFSHPTLKLLLPLIANLIHDKAEKNRLAFIKLLVDIKGVRGIHFYEVVSVPHLLERFVEDRCNLRITSSLSGLLLESFYPQVAHATNANQAKAKIDKEVVNRCIQFVEESPVAAEAFYSNLHNLIAIGSVVKLTVMIFHVIQSSNSTSKSFIPNVRPASKRARQISTSDEIGNDIFNSISDKTRSSLIRIIFILLDSVKDQLIGENYCLDVLFKYFSGLKYQAFFDQTIIYFGDRPDVVITLLKLTQILLKFSNSSEGTVQFDTFNHLELRFWWDSVGIRLLKQNFSLPIQQEICRNLVALVIVTGKLNELIRKISFNISSTSSTVVEQNASILCFAALVEVLCQPSSSSLISDQSANEFEILLQTSFKFLEFSMVSSLSDDLKQCCICLSQSMSCWCVFQDCSERIINPDTDLGLSRPIISLSQWVIQLPDPSCYKNLDVYIMISTNVLLALTDAYVLLQEENHSMLLEQMGKIISTLALKLRQCDSQDIVLISPKFPYLLETFHRLVLICLSYRFHGQPTPFSLYWVCDLFFAIGVCIAHGQQQNEIVGKKCFKSLLEFLDGAPLNIIEGFRNTFMQSLKLWIEDDANHIVLECIERHVPSLKENM